VRVNVSQEPICRNMYNLSMLTKQKWQSVLMDFSNMHRIFVEFGGFYLEPY